MKISKNNNLSKTLVVLCLIAIRSIAYSQDTNIPSPPSGYDAYQLDIARGTNEIVSYYSSVADTNRKTRIYLPPGYSPDSLYNVLYLLHGIGGDINEWYNLGSPNYILDNLYSKGRIAPMIVVLPNGRAMKDDSPGSNIYAADKVQGFADFEIELINDLIPFIDTTYPVKREREARAIAGLSMGGGQALNIGLSNIGTFAFVGGFSSAPNTNKVGGMYSDVELIPDIKAAKEKLKLLWIGCGNKDGLIRVSQGAHQYFKEKGVPHIWHVDTNAHDNTEWDNNLYLFAQHLFKK